MRNLVLITQVSMSFLGSVFLGFYIGLKLDQWLKLNGVFSIILLIIGVLSGILNAYKLIMSTNRRNITKIEEKEDK